MECVRKFSFGVRRVFVDNCIKNAGAAICIVWIYTAAQILDVEKNFSFLAIYMYEADTLKSVQHKEILLIFLGSICTVLGQRRMNQLQVKEG